MCVLQMYVKNDKCTVEVLRLQAQQHSLIILIVLEVHPLAHLNVTEVWMMGLGRGLSSLSAPLAENETSDS